MVRLQPMTQEEYEDWRSLSIQDYARENVAAGRWSEGEAKSKAEREFASLLPNGRATEGHYVCCIVDENASEKVGMIWYALRQESGSRFVFVYDLRIHEEHRRRGYGTAALKRLEEETRGLGLDVISLHVFGHNKGARDLYRRAGYEEKSVLMSKKLSTP